MPERFDVVVIGAGAAGMMCAAVAGQRGRSVLLIDHAEKLAEKIRISGGGRCNFTNIGTTATNFVGQNPKFCRSALARFGPRDFIELMRRYHIPFHEKHRGQLFCDRSSEDIIEMLVAECTRGGVHWRRPCAVRQVEQSAAGYRVQTDLGAFEAKRLVIATGGLSIPKIGATDFGYRVARQFGLRIVEPRPALVPLTFATEMWKPYVPMSGIAVAASVAVDGDSLGFDEDLLFTHRGLSGPAILQISSYWNPGAALRVDLVPTVDLGQALCTKKSGSKQNFGNALYEWLPKRLADEWTDNHSKLLGRSAESKLADLPDAALRQFGASLNRWSLVPDGTEGFKKAEATRGGVDTRELSQTTMESVRAAGLYFIGEVVDVTGWLGGYNFQWAWASAVAAGMAV